MSRSYNLFDPEEMIPLFHVFKTLFSGTISGIAGTVVGYPLDTVKVRLQLQSDPPKYKGTWDCLKQIVKKESFGGLFKGMSSPILGCAPINALLFAGNDFSMSMMAGRDISNVAKIYISGCFGGLLCCLVTVPVELLKCRSQNIQERVVPLREMLFQTLKNEGPSVLYRGWWVTFWRDVPTYGLYFHVYDVFKRQIFQITKDPLGDTAAEITCKLIAGGLAGWASWIASFPFDVVKSIIQVESKDKTLKMGPIFKQYYKSHGIKFFFRGLTPTLLRAFPQHACVFLVYDYLNSLIL